MRKAIVVADDAAERIFRSRLQGRSERSLAREYGLTTKAVRAIVAARIPQLDHEGRAIEFGLELLRLEELLAVFHSRAKAGDVPSAAVYCRLSERRSCMLGTDVAPRRDLTIVSVEQAPRPGSTERIRQVIEQLCRDGRSQPAPIEAEIIEAEPAP